MKFVDAPLSTKISIFSLLIVAGKACIFRCLWDNSIKVDEDDEEMEVVDVDVVDGVVVVGGLEEVVLPADGLASTGIRSLIL